MTLTVIWIALLIIAMVAATLFGDRIIGRWVGALAIALINIIAIITLTGYLKILGIIGLLIALKSVHNVYRQT